MTILKELSDLMIGLSAKVKAMANWAYMHPGRRIGPFILVTALLAGGYSLTIKYLESQVLKASTLQMDELRRLELENRASQAIDAINLCMSTPSDDDRRDWYCEEALNMYKAEAPPVLPERTARMIEQRAYPLMVLQLKSDLRRIAYLRALHAEPTKEALVLKELIRWTWAVIALIFLPGFIWLGLLYRKLHRSRALQNSLPRLEDQPAAAGELDQSSSLSN